MSQQKEETVKMYSIKKEKLWNFIFFISSVVILIYPAILNGYPLLHVDSPVYIVSGHIKEIRVDSSYIYSFFIRHVSLSWSLWVPILVQSAIVSYLIFQFIFYFIKPKKSYIIHLILTLFLSYFTSLSYYCSLIMPDIFSSTMILSLILLLLTPQKKGHLLAVGIVFGLSTLSSFDNIYLGIILLIVYAIIMVFMNKYSLNFLLKRSVYVFGILGISLFVMAFIHYSNGYGFKLQNSTNILLNSQLTDFGLTQKFLDKNCNSESNYISREYCGDVEKLHNLSRWEYLYSPISPLYEDCKDVEWQKCWLMKEESLKALNTQILSVPELRLEYFIKVMSRSFKQLMSYTFPKLPSVNIESELVEFYEEDHYSFMHANQKNNKNLYSLFNLREVLSLNACFLISILIFIYYWKSINWELRILMLFIFLAAYINALMCAFIHEVDSMQQGRIVYIFHLVIGILCIKLYKNSNKYKIIDLRKII